MSGLAYVNYTSGSTGKPKGALIEHRSVVRLVRDTNYIEITPDDRILQAGSIAFDACTFEVWGALLNGACVVIAKRDDLLDPLRFAALLQRERITVLFLTTSLFNQFADFDPSLFGTLRVLLTGGEKSSPRHFDRVREACPELELLHVYGPTENTTFSTYHVVDEPCGDDVPIGKAIARSTALILDHNLQRVADGAPGEICVGGDGVARGYLNDAELTAKKFVRGLYRTGDLGRLLPDGSIQFLGRIDRQIKIRGFRVEPGEIEQHLLARDGVAQAVVLVREQGASRELAAYYTGEVSAADLRNALEEALPFFMVPAEITHVDAMPLTTAGKIDRAALAAITTTRDADTRAPQSENEQLLVRVWSEVLGRAAGVDDNYFQLGGDSIKAIQINSRLRQAGKRMEVRDLFVHQTIARLAPLLQTQRTGKTRGAFTGIVPLSPIQRWFLREFRGPLHHFHMPVLLRANEPLDRDRLRDALQELWTHHDLLRATFDGETQRVGEPTSQVAFVDAIDPASFDLKRGPLFQASLDGDELLLVAHHLIVDAVSWRILIEDLERAYRGEPLPPRTTPFAEWTRQLEEQQSLEVRGTEVPIDHPDAPNRYGDARTIDFALHALDAHNVSELRDVLLTALTSALRRWHGCDASRIAIEGHGRDALPLDVSRTVGWFTTIQPFVVPLPRLHFNYLGDLAEPAPGLFTLLPRVPIQAISPDLERQSDVDVLAGVTQGALRVAITYGVLRYERRTIERFARDLEQELYAALCAPLRSAK